MEIDWKKVSQSSGYISMKAAVAKEANICAKQKWCKAPDERYQEAFEFAINRAKHYAYYHNVSLESVLNSWEMARTYNFISYYTDHHLPKFDRIYLKPNGINAHRKYYKTWHCHSSRRVNSERILRLISEEQVKNNTRNKDKKSRWSNERKERAAYFRDRQSL